MKIKKILLIFPPYPIPKIYPKRVQLPLGIIYLAGALLREGYEVKLIDASIEGWEKSIEVGNDQVQYGLYLEDIMTRVRQEKPDVIGISCMFGVQLKNSSNLAGMIKSEFPNTAIVMGGALASECAAQILENCKTIDYIIIGEGEESFVSLLKYLNYGRDNLMENIDGIAYRSGCSRVMLNKKTKYIDKLDDLAIPARGLLPVRKYFELNRSHGTVSRMAKATTIITSRGCPGKCIFCSIHSVWGHDIRFRSPENVVNEIISLQNEFGITEFQIEDDNFTFDVDRAVRFCDLIIEKKIKANFSTPNGIAVWSLNKELLKKMKKAGFYKLTLAIESGSEHTLKQIIKKPLDLIKIKEIVKESLKQGFIVDTFFVIGLPGETPEDLRKTFALSRALNTHSVKYFIATPYPGTELYRFTKSKGMLNKNYFVDDFSMTPAKSIINTEYFTCQEIDRIWLRESLKTQLFLFLRRPVSYTKNIFLDYFRKDFSAIIGFLSAFLKFKNKAKMQDGYYHLALRNNPIQRFWHSKKFELVSTKTTRAPVVDVGSGPGAFFNIHGNFDGLKINLDYSLGQLFYSQNINPGISHINASATDMPFLSESVFTILLIETIEHFNEEGFNKILDEIWRVLKKGGKAVISTPNYKSIWPFLELVVSAIGPVNYMEQHITHFDIKKLSKILQERGLKIIDKKTIFIISPFLAVFSRKLAEFVFSIEQKLFSKSGSVIIMEVIKE